MTMLRSSVLSRFAAMAFLAAAVTGCATQAPTQTGFLGDYSRLQPTRDHPDDPGWHRSAALAPYRGFIVDTVVYRPTKGAPALDNKTETDLAAEYRRRLTEAFAKCFRLADAPGAGVMRVHAAITNVAKAQPVLNFITMAAILVPVANGGTSTEAEVVDSVTGERLAAYLGYNNGSRSFLGGPIGALSQYGQARRAFRVQAEELRDVLLQDAAMCSAHRR